MDKLNTLLYGGFPLELDDLRWQFQAYDRAFKGISDAFGTGYILSGCEVDQPSPGQYTIAPGFVVMQGEIYEFTGYGPGGINPANTYFTPFLDTDPTGSEVFEDLTTQNAYERRRAGLALSPPGPLPPVACNIIGPRLVDRLWLMGRQMRADWNVLDTVGQPPLLNDWVASSGNPPRFRREPGSLVRLQGIIIGTSSTSTHAFTLPAGYRPAQAISRDLFPYGGEPANARVCLLISTAGVATLSNLSGSRLSYDLSACSPWEVA